VHPNSRQVQEVQRSAAIGPFRRGSRYRETLYVTRFWAPRLVRRLGTSIDFKSPVLRDAATVRGIAFESLGTPRKILPFEKESHASRIVRDAPRKVRRNVSAVHSRRYRDFGIGGTLLRVSSTVEDRRRKKWRSFPISYRRKRDGCAIATRYVIIL